jgi:hypothetical protein
MTRATWMPNRPAAEVTENSRQRVAPDSSHARMSFADDNGRTGGLLGLPIIKEKL